MGTPLINDDQFDKLEVNLFRVDPKANYFSKKSILPLPSLPKDSIDDFLNGLLPDTRLIIEPKIDGCAIALQYIDGELIKAISRKGGDLTFLIEELESVFDPNGGYYKKGGKYVPSLVAELGQVLEEHLKNIGMLKVADPEEHQKKLIDEKKAEYLKKNPDKLDESGFPKDAQLCNKCNTKAAIMMDGCLTCLNCGESKCG